MISTNTTRYFLSLCYSAAVLSASIMPCSVLAGDIQRTVENPKPVNLYTLSEPSDDSDALILPVRVGKSAVPPYDPVNPHKPTPPSIDDAEREEFAEESDVSFSSSE